MYKNMQKAIMGIWNKGFKRSTTSSHINACKIHISSGYKHTAEIK